MAFQLGDAANANVRKRVAQSIAFNEPVIASEMAQARRLDELHNSSLSRTFEDMATVDRVGRDRSVPQLPPAQDAGRPAIGQKPIQPTQGHADLLRSNPGAWQAFDQKFGPGAASRALSGTGADPWGDRRKAIPKKDNPSEFEKPKPGWFGR